MSEGFFLFVFTLLLFIAYKKRSRAENKVGITGKLIWLDEGKQTKPFFNSQFLVVGKPDQIYKTTNGLLAVEYKSRKGAIYPSDIVQAKCAVLAARPQYIISRVLIKTSSQEKYISLPTNNQKLYNDIKKYLDIARNAKAGAKLPPLPTKYKCHSCAYKNSCTKRAASAF